MYCPNCGTQNRDVSKFCTSCGQPLAAPPPQPSVTAIIPPAPSSAPATPPPPTAPGRTAMLGAQSVLRGRYLIVKLLAQGGMGAAYLGQDQSTFGRQVVIKEMLANYTTQQEKLDAERNFAREGQVLASLNHPGIPQINDYFIEQDKYYLVMTLAQGENLEDRLAAAGGRLLEKDVTDYGLQIANILVYLAAMKPPVIHRDIKPAKIILNKQTGRVTLVDFGLAKAKHGTGVMNVPTVGGVIQSTPMGTPGYAPPEQYQGRTDSRSDVYALAATMHHLLTGIDPRQATMPFDFAPLTSVLPNTSPALDALLRRALDPNPATRPTAQQMESDLKNLATPSVVKHVSIAGPFHFRGGDTANNIDELAQKAEQHWDDGTYHLTQGHFEPWLRAQNRHDLATIAEGIRTRGGDASAGLEELLRALNPQLQPPVLAISATLLDFGVVTKGETREQDFQITNRGRGYLYGTLKSNVPWLTLSASSVACKNNQTQTIKLKLDTRPMKEGAHARPVMEIDTNGGRQSVAAQTQVAWAPALTLAPRSRLSFGDVMVNTGAPVTRTLTITNSGGGTLSGQVTAQGGWFNLDTQDFTVPSGQKVELHATAATRGLVVGIYDGQVSVTSNVGDVVLPAQIGVKKPLYELPARAMRWGFFAAFALVALFACSLTTSLGARGLLNIAPVHYFATIYQDLLRRFSTFDSNLANNLSVVTVLTFGVVGMIAFGASRMLNRSLNEIEDYYHGGALAQEISSDRFEGWRYLAIILLLTFFGIPIGVRFGTATANDWLGWGLLIGPIAGILIGNMTISAGRIDGTGNLAARLSAFVRVIFVSGGMATWGVMLNATRNNHDWFAPFAWAAAGFVLTSASLKLPARLQWFLGIIRRSLIIAFFGYIVETEINALISFFAYGGAYFPPFDSYYGSFPGVTGFDRVIVDVILMMAILAGGMAGLVAVNDASIHRKQIAQTVGLALFPALLLGVVGMIVGGVVFFILTLGRGWGFGAMVVTAIVIVAGLATFRWQSSRLERGELALKTGLTRLLKNRPLPGWVNRFSLVALARDLSPVAIGITATIATMILPFVIQTALSLLIVLLCLAVLAVGAGVVVFVIIFAARNQSGKLPRMP